MGVAVPFSFMWLTAISELDHPARIWMYTDPYGYERKANPQETKKCKESLRAWYCNQARQYLERVYRR